MYVMANGCGCLLAKQNSSVTYMYIYSSCVLIGFVLDCTLIYLKLLLVHILVVFSGSHLACSVDSC